MRLGSQRIKQIQESGYTVLVSLLVENVLEVQAIRLEAELISAFGTQDTGGLLTNSIIPSGLSQKSRPNVILPSGIKEKAQIGLNLLKEAVLELIKANPRGITNSEAASLLGLRSDYGGGSKDYLSYSILGLLMREGRIRRHGSGRRHTAQVG
jgi:uncharacterized protein